MISRKYEIKKHVIGEDPDLEKSGRILNNVIERSRDGTTIEADQRHVREIMKDLELQRANHSATHADSKGENRRGRRQTQTKHEWDGTGDGDGRDRPQMSGDDANDSQALTGGDITRYRALVARVCYLSRPTRSQVRQCRYVVRWQDHQCVTWSVSRGSEDSSLGSREQSAGCGGSRVTSWKRIKTLTGEATKTLDDGCRPESS